MRKPIPILTASATLAGTVWVSAVSGTQLTAVPMQGTMVMPMVAYRAETGRLEVSMPAEVPQLTPLLISHPGDGFDPAAPWFDCLDPTRRGMAFSRRYGFVMNVATDPLPENTAMWIRKLGASPQLEFYRYAGSPPQAWEPIFGTAGSPDERVWNGMMFHPGVAAPAATEALTATFALFLVDTQTGEEIPESDSGPLVFEWTNVSDGRPGLDIGLRVVVSWPATTSDYVLESADSPVDAVWTEVAGTPVTFDGQTAMVLNPDAAAKYFRLRKTN